MNSETLLRAAYDLGASNAYRDSPKVGFDPQAWAKFSTYVSEKVNSDKDRDYWMERAYAAEDKLRKSHAALAGVVQRYGYNDSGQAIAKSMYDIASEALK
jgi:hypothetical protein